VTRSARPTQGPRPLIVDGANVVGSRPDGWWRDRPAAARRLLESLASGREALAAAGLDPVVLVLEGAARAGAAADATGPIVVVHAAGSGDDQIVAQCGERSPGPVVVTADRALAQRVRAEQADVMRPSELLALLAAT